MSEPTWEYEQAKLMAHRALEAPFADLDIELRMISRQFVRTAERLEALSSSLREAEKERDALRVRLEEMRKMLEYTKSQIPLPKDVLMVIEAALAANGRERGK